MDILVIAFVFAIGIAVWYMIFYFRYEQKDVIDEMRNRLTANVQDIQAMKIDLMEYIEQNKILKEKANDLLVKNDDLSKIVAEMSRYYQYLKNAYEKAKDLADFLKVFEETEHKTKHIAPHKHVAPLVTQSTPPTPVVSETIQEHTTSSASTQSNQTKKIF